MTGELAIANLVYTYAELVDAGDFAGVGALFADATYRAVSSGGTSVFTGGQVATLLERMVKTYDGVPATKHVTTNLIIEVDEGAGNGTCRSYYMVVQGRPQTGLRPIIAGRYRDAFARHDGVWAFSDRLIYSDLVGDLSDHLVVDPYS